MPARKALESAKATTLLTRFLRVKQRTDMRTAASPRKAMTTGSDTIHLDTSSAGVPGGACRQESAGMLNNLQGLSINLLLFIMMNQALTAEPPPA
jgi:hypothetical protein